MSFLFHLGTLQSGEAIFASFFYYMFITYHNLIKDTADASWLISTEKDIQYPLNLVLWFNNKT